MRRRDFLAAMALAAASLVTAGCEEPQDDVAEAVDLMAGVERASQGPASPAQMAAASEALCGFGLALARASDDGASNLLVSPLSAQMALALAANGAAGTTLSQMEEVLGAPKSELGVGLGTLAASAGGQLRLANSIWVREGYEVEREFLQINADTLGADAYQAPFDDATVRQINDWVSERTDAMVTDVLDQIPDLAQLYLVNALALDADWANPYTTDQIEDGTFTTADGSTQRASYLRAEEGSYLELAGSTGFLKAYEGETLGFVGLLPAKGHDPADLLDSLDATTWCAGLASIEATRVVASMPKFSYDWEADLAAPLVAMGMEDAFDAERADFSAMARPSDGSGLALGRVLHKAHVDVDERGTRAGAATVVEATETSANVDVAEPRRVTLDRPFAYAIVDLATSAPVFLGIVRTLA